MPQKGVYSSTNYNVAVVGFLPVEKPEYVVAVGFQKPKGDHSVGRVALPAFAEVVKKLKKEKSKSFFGSEAVYDGRHNEGKE